MSSGKKQQKKRKHHSSPPSKSKIARRLEKLRGGQRDLWEDDDDDDEQSKPTNKKKSIIVLTDSEEERPSSSSHRRSQRSKSRKKTSRSHTENATCLICSILSQLSSYNCCAQHLSILKNPSQHQHQTIRSQRLRDQVMIIPMTDEIVQRYLDPQQTQHLQRQTSTSPINKKTSERNVSTRKSVSQSTMTPNHSEVRQSMKNTPKSSIKSTQMDSRPTASSIVVESARSNSTTIPRGITITTVTSSSSICVTDNVENTTTIDENQLPQSPIQTIIIDDSQPENTLVRSTNAKKPSDPWIPISDEIDEALERALDQIDSSFDTPLEFTPATVRRTETELMAALLPKIPLKEGRFRGGKPIMNRTISNAANEYRPTAAVQSSPPTSSALPPSIRSPLTTTNAEKESSCQILNQSENTTDIFTQDETSRHDNIPITTLSNESLASVFVTNENSNIEVELHRSNEAHCVTSSTVREKPTPSRVSFLLNPDGTRVRVSRPPLPANHQSPLLTSLRRTSTDVTPIQSNTKQV